MKRYIVTILLIIFLVSCSRRNDLQEAYLDNDYNLVLNEQKYIFVGSGANLSKKSKVAYINNGDGYKSNIYSIKGYDEGEWILEIMHAIMGDWVLYRAEKVDYMPMQLSDKLIGAYNQKVTYNNLTYQLYACVPGNKIELKEKTESTYILDKEYFIHSITGQYSSEWIVLIEKDFEEKYYLYHESNINSVPIEFFNFGKETYVDQNGVYQFHRQG